MKAVLLGPQQTRVTLGTAVSALETEGAIATITAGWQEREDQDTELETQLGRKTINLRIYQRAEAVLEEDAEFAAAHRARQEQLRQIQEFYRLRLERTFDAALDIERKTAGTELQAGELQLSMEQIRRLDAEHLDRCMTLRESFDERYKPLERAAIMRHRKDITAQLANTPIVAIAGGHVAALLNRLRMFGVGDLIKKHALVAWSAGAMVTGERIVLFHESPPEGKGISEVLEQGLALHRGVLPLPNPRLRLKLDDPFRVGWFARRYAPARCVAFDQGDWVLVNGKTWSSKDGTAELKVDGSVDPGWAS